MSEPTPRPWRVSKAGVFVESRKESICAMFTEDVLMDNYEANRDHIVKCVNMHDGLVAAYGKVETALLYVGCNSGGHKRLEEVAMEALLAVTAALAETAEVAG